MVFGVLDRRTGSPRPKIIGAPSRQNGNSVWCCLGLSDYFGVRIALRGPEVATAEFLAVSLILIDPPIAHVPVLFFYRQG
jgi:hypothetical protein